MAGERKEIRNAVKTILVAAATIAGNNVFANRSVPLWESADLPGIIIYTPVENASVFNEGPRLYERALNLVIEGVIKESVDDVDPIDDLLDDFADQVEAALEDNRYLVVDDEKKAADLVLTQFTSVVNSDGERPIAGFKMVYSVMYYREAISGVSTVGEPDDLAQVNNTWNPGGDEDSDKLYDEIGDLDA